MPNVLCFCIFEGVNYMGDSAGNLQMLQTGSSSYDSGYIMFSMNLWVSGRIKIANKEWPSVLGRFYDHITALIFLFNREVIKHFNYLYWLSK